MFEARTAGDMKKEKTAELNAAQDAVKKAQSDFDSASKHFEKDKADREEGEKHVDKATQEHGIATYELQQKQGVWDLLKELKTQIAKFYGTLDTLVENIEAGEPVEGEGPWERIEKEPHTKVFLTKYNSVVKVICELYDASPTTYKEIEAAVPKIFKNAFSEIHLIGDTSISEEENANKVLSLFPALGMNRHLLCPHEREATKEIREVL